MRSHKILNIAPANAALQNLFSKELSVSRILAQVLANRGITGVGEAENFLKIDLSDLIDPYRFSHMQEAVNLVKKAAQARQRVMVFGDYDVDGITSLTLLKNTLAKLGIQALHHLPHRLKEGYGLNKNTLEIARAKGIKLLITVDCGTNSVEEVRQLRRHGIEVVITDHHEPSSHDLPPASAIINPKVASSGYGYRELAGVGVAYKLCQALTGTPLAEDLDLVALGTIADVVPLTGENRIIAKEGLLQLGRTEKIGLQALMETSGIRNKRMTSTFVSYILGPRINASGRMATAEVALNLLLSEARQEAEGFAKIIEAYNRQRQKIEGQIMEEAQDLIDQEINFKEHKVIVIAKEGWHQGVLGVVASKLADRFYRPTILISLTEDLCKGSGRSIKNFHLFHTLAQCKELLTTFGGHSHAVGLTIARDNVADFKVKINDLARERLRLEDLLPSVDIDIEAGLGEVTEKVVAELELLEPFGAGNPEPLFLTRNLRLKGEPLRLSRETLKFWVTDGKITHQAIGFGMASLRDSLVNADYLDLVYTPQLDNWNGQASVILEARDIFFR